MCGRGCCRWFALIVLLFACFVHWATHPSFTPQPPDPIIQADATAHGSIRRLKVNGNSVISTFIHETKPESKGSIVIYITGAGLPSTIWSRMQEELGYRSLVYDREGVGWSDLAMNTTPGKSQNMSSCPISACAHLIAVVDTIIDGIARNIILVGHSLGGALTLACAPDLDRHLQQTSKWRVWTLVLLESISPIALSEPAFLTLLPMAAGALYRSAEYGLLDNEIEIFQLSKLPKPLLEPTRRVMLSLRHWAGFAKEVDSLHLIPACLAHKDYVRFPTISLTAEGRTSIDLDYPITRDFVPGADHMSIITDEKIAKLTAQKIGLFMFARSQ